MSRAIITHPGNAHLDDLLVVALAITSATAGGAPIHRREPAREEIRDPEVLVLDVGGIYADALGCYDHHQDRSLPCALHLWERYHPIPGIRRLDWWERASDIDARGPFAWAAAHSTTPRVLEELRSPVEGWLLDEFARASTIAPTSWLYRALQRLGIYLREQARQLHEGLEALRSVTMEHRIDGLRVLVVDALPPQQGLLPHLVREYHRDGDPIAVTISHDDRGDGWTLFREQDHPRVDFSRLADHPAITFAHQVGFVAKTLSREEISRAVALSLVEEALSLVEQAITEGA